MNRREIIFEAASEAHRLHNNVSAKEHVISNGGGIDVFGIIQKLSILLLFKPLDRLLGTYLPYPYDGMMITSERNLAIQRFTASHELGHKILKHKSISLDDESILNRSPFGNEFYNLDELGADAFAATFLIPEWILEVHADRQGWDGDSLIDPKIVYQLSLRIGASYKATCRQLFQYKLIDKTTLQALISIPPKKIKQSFLDEIKLPNWHPNVWVLTNRDEGMLIQGGPNDVFLFRLKESSGSGYLWNIEELRKSGFAVLSDENIILNPNPYEEVGSNTERIIITSSKDETTPIGNINLKQLRPWDISSVINTLELNYELLKESGLPQVVRRLALAS